MSLLTIRISPELGYALEARGLTSEPHVSEWVTDAIRQKLDDEQQNRILESRAVRGSREAFERVLAKVPDTDPAEEDRL